MIARVLQKWLKVSFSRADGGGALIELAMIAPVVMVFSVGVIDIGRLIYYNILATNAAHAGVEYGMQNSTTAADTAGMQNAAMNDAQNTPYLSATASKFCTCADGTNSTCAPTDCSANHQLYYVKVIVSGTVPVLLRYPGIGQALTMSRTAVMQVAQ
jgi:Flp pilus assembly protein TadG